MRVRALAGIVAGGLIGALSLAGFAPASPSADPHTSARPSLSYMKSHFTVTNACGTAAKAGYARCLAKRLAVKPGLSSQARTQAAATSAAVSGLGPSDIQDAYGLTGLSTGSTVAIVDAYGYPNAERDLATYRSYWGLPSCTKSNGCLTIVNQSGGSTPPSTDYGWAGEQALDLDAVSAACPSCKILLVQTNSASIASLGAGVNQAARTSGVKAISNSYGGGDISDADAGSYYNHSGIAVTASAGDDGYQGASFPASSHYVTAIGGTSLTQNSSARGWGETVWDGTGSGCSTSNQAPSGQSSSVTGCSGRAMNDVAAVADPYTGLAVYAPNSSGTSGWAQYGGTSLSSPIIASVYALSGNTAGYANSIPYSNPGALNDVTSGSNGSCANYCTARSGWDGPTGLGTPNGTGAF